MVFFPALWSSVITFIIVMAKCSFDKSRGRKGELHDFICAIIGILVGVILAYMTGVVPFM
jgi:hypothetical protein